MNPSDPSCSTGCDEDELAADVSAVSLLFRSVGRDENDEDAGSSSCDTSGTKPALDDDVADSNGRPMVGLEVGLLHKLTTKKTFGLDSSFSSSSSSFSSFKEDPFQRQMKFDSTTLAAG